MALETYRQKRNFTATPEPKGKRAAAKGCSYVIQKHAARRLHYDFRLEMDGVLKSWAVTRGPSEVAGEKRLAVHVEDHPLEYGGFEGTIPKGEYGGGSVILWDRGSWTSIGDASKGYAKGHLEFELHGEKLHGRWRLVRMERKPREKNDNWLLIKADDDFAKAPGAPDVLDERPESVRTGRQIEDLKGDEPGWSSKTAKINPSNPNRKPQTSISPSKNVNGAKTGPLPDFVEPELATLAEKPPGGARWLHEIKFDGYRLQARVFAPEQVTLLTRNGLDWTSKFGSKIAAAFRELLVESALIDGELVVENASGAPDFSALQADLSAGRTDRFVYYAFDLLYLNGYDLRAAPLIARKERLAKIIPQQTGALRFSAHFEDDGELILRHICRLSLEGIVSKLKDSPYRSGRGRNWLKVKCSNRQEFVIGGYVDSAAASKAVGSLVLGYYEKGKLLHAGRVGTGFTAAAARDLYARLDRIRRSSSPFSKPLAANAARAVRYVEPEFIAEVEFRGWTADHNLRHASFRGLREDKPAAKVEREATSLTSAAPKSAVTLTHPDRLYWPDAGVTKEGLADYYAVVWPRMAPFVIGRPLSLLRCPDGIGGTCFFQKHVWRGAGRSIRLEIDPADPTGEPILGVDDLDGLISLVQAGVLEIHPWGSTWAALEQPDMIIMDLDPGEGTSWADVVSSAIEVRDRLIKLGLAAFVKTSGGKGLHVVSPLRPEAKWPAVKAFAKSIAEAMARDAPGLYVANIAKAKRRGKILVDYLRNGRGATAVSPYSTRARPGAPVSMPLDWNELGSGIGPPHLTVSNAADRLSNLKTDPWAGFLDDAVPLPAAQIKYKT
jgi:bifunctional non-homologous end joining protein LigD